MFTSTSEARARFAARALLTFASQVRKYCQSYPRRVAGLKEPERRQAMSRFLENAMTLTRMLQRLNRMARELGTMRILNFEQLEAETDAALSSLRMLHEQEALRN